MHNVELFGSAIKNAATEKKKKLLYATVQVQAVCKLHNRQSAGGP